MAHIQIFAILVLVEIINYPLSEFRRREISMSRLEALSAELLSPRLRALADLLDESDTEMEAELDPHGVDEPHLSLDTTSTELTMITERPCEATPPSKERNKLQVARNSIALSSPIKAPIEAPVVTPVHGPTSDPEHQPLAELVVTDVLEKVFFTFPRSVTSSVRHSKHVRLVCTDSGSLLRRSIIHL